MTRTLEEEGVASVGGPIPYAYILGASHSGTTLLAFLLNAHPEVTSVGELASGDQRDLSRYLCSCRVLMHECCFWRSVKTSVAALDPRFDLSDLGMRFERGLPHWVSRLVRMEHRGKALEAARDLLLWSSPAWRTHFAEMEERWQALATTVLRLTGARVVVDSSKLAHRLKFLRRIRAFDVKVIHLVRDGRAVALSYMDPDRFADASDPALRRGGDGKGGAPPTNLPMWRAADEWRRSIRSAKFALARLDRSQWMRVHYEDLCRHPQEVCRDLFAFLGVDPSRACPDYRAVAHHVVGNGMRLDSTSEVRLDERWRSVLGPEDLRTFEKVAGPLNRRYGYS